MRAGEQYLHRRVSDPGGDIGQIAAISKPCPEQHQEYLLRRISDVDRRCDQTIQPRVELGDGLKNPLADLP